MRHFVVFAALAMLLGSGVIGIQAQTATPTPLSPGDSKRGVLTGQGDSVTVRFSVPGQKDMLIRYSADKILLISTCVGSDGAPICPQEGSRGGDGDPPVSGTIYVPSSDQTQTVDLTLYRPTDGAANYQIETFGFSPTGVGLDTSLTISPASANTHFASYVLNVNPDQPFVVEIEDANASGDYLWVAHDPLVSAHFKATEIRQTFPTGVDAAWREDNPKGVSSLELYYLGGHEFRVLVTSNGTFLLNTRSLNVPLLDAGVSLPLTISYRNPVSVVRLNTSAGDVAKVDFQIPAGKRAVAEVFQQGGSIGDSLELGYNRNERAAAPIAGTIHEVATERPLYALIQLGDGSTRDSVRATLTWTKES